MTTQKIWTVYEAGSSAADPLTEVKASSERSALDHASAFYGVPRERLYAVPGALLTKAAKATKASAGRRSHSTKALANKPSALKLEAMKRGEAVITNDEEMDQMLALGDDAIKKVRSLPNPQRVGLKDQYIAWIGGQKPPQHSTIAKNRRSLSEEQLAALRTFAQDNGRNWKRELNHAWSTGDWSHDYADNSGLLQQVRNEFGPSWLVRFSFKNPKTHSAQV